MAICVVFLGLIGREFFERAVVNVDLSFYTSFVGEFSDGAGATSVALFTLVFLLD